MNKNKEKEKDLAAEDKEEKILVSGKWAEVEAPPDKQKENINRIENLCKILLKINNLKYIKKIASNIIQLCHSTLNCVKI